MVSFSVNKESIIDIKADVVAVQNKIESCTEQTLELFINEIYVISEAKAQLPLQIEDAARPELSGVSLTFYEFIENSLFFSVIWSLYKSLTTA